jgi:hypothetical protein
VCLPEQRNASRSLNREGACILWRIFEVKYSYYILFGGVLLQKMGNSDSNSAPLHRLLKLGRLRQGRSRQQRIQPNRISLLISGKLA